MQEDQKQLPDGFATADTLSQKEKPRGRPLPEAEPRRKQKEGEPLKVESLREALEQFKYRVDATRLGDVKLEGMRVGAVFRRDSGADGDEEKYLVTFKREFYFHFSRHFPNVKEKGYGVIANMKLVHWAAVEGMRVAAVFPDARCYWIDGMEFWNFYEDNETECEHAPGEIASSLSLWKRLF